jgi:phosphatidylglycerol:prolipoprotein diacylglycerol transferase
MGGTGPVLFGFALPELGLRLGTRCIELPFAISFTNPQSLAPLNVLLHPTQIYSVFSNLILFFILLLLQKKKRFDGMVFLVYLILYALFRSFIEFFRGDFRGDFFFDFLSLSQGLGISVSVIASIFFYHLYRKHNGQKA